jgi:carbonic anhydrase
MNMNNLDSMLKGNKDFAAQQSAAGTLMPSLPRAMPNVKAIIIGCADMRADPAHVLGIKPREAVVMRNTGGRITPGLLEQLGLLGRIGEVAGAIPAGGGEFHIIVLQHTDCGITRLAGNPDTLARYFQIRKANSAQKQSLTPARRLPLTLLRSGRFPYCRPIGSYQASSITWRADWLKSSYHPRPFALRKKRRQPMEGYFCHRRNV